MLRSKSSVLAQMKPSMLKATLSSCILRQCRPHVSKSLMLRSSEKSATILARLTCLLLFLLLSSSMLSASLSLSLPSWLSLRLMLLVLMGCAAHIGVGAGGPGLHRAGLDSGRCSSGLMVLAFSAVLVV